MKSKIASRILEETPRETVMYVRKYAEIVARVHDILKAQGLTQRELALRMGKNPSELTRWLKGEHNLTLKSLIKLETELGEEIFTIQRCSHPAAELPRQEVGHRAEAEDMPNWTSLQISVPHSRLAESCIA